jgi:hypothetical protein
MVKWGGDSLAPANLLGRRRFRLGATRDQRQVRQRFAAGPEQAAPE